MHYNKKILVTVSVLTLTLLGATPLAQAVYARERSVVIVGCFAEGQPVPTLRDLRRAYLGIPVVVDELELEPLHNVSDSQLNEIFLQKLLYMSASSYDRQLVSNVFRFGGRRPRMIDDEHDLAKAIGSKPAAVAAVWEDEARQGGCVKRLAVLWSGSSE